MHNTMLAVVDQAKKSFRLPPAALLGQPARIFERLHSGQGGMHRAFCWCVRWHTATYVLVECNLLRHKGRPSLIDLSII